MLLESNLRSCVLLAVQGLYTRHPQQVRSHAIRFCTQAAQLSSHIDIGSSEMLPNLREVANAQSYNVKLHPELPLPSPVPNLAAWKARRGLLDGCEPQRSPLTVALLLSGGVDSSLALRLLQAAGHHVTAFYLQIWFQEDFRNFWDACPWEEDLAVCQQVCDQAGVELKVVPLTEHYWDRVVAHSIAEIRAGRTPNPDILCNTRVKFGAFMEYLETIEGQQFDRIASGHYARLLRGEQPQDRVSLALSPDSIKDQTYFLSHLSQAQLSRLIFPLGQLTKGSVRQLAAEAGLPNQARKDSQGICFLGKVNFSEFVERHLGQWPGALVDADSGEVVGYHQGCWFFTVGQRKGIFLSGGPWYVSGKDMDTNAVYISKEYHSEAKLRNAFVCGGFNWIHGSPPTPGSDLLCKVRHGPTLYRCAFELLDGGKSGRVWLEGNDQGLAPGQYAAFYQDSFCLGSAVIQASTT